MFRVAASRSLLGPLLSRSYSDSLRMLAKAATAPAPGVHTVTLFAGDGIGPEIAAAVTEIFSVRGALPKLFVVHVTMRRIFL